MYTESQGNAGGKGFVQSQEDVEVTIRNLPNEAKTNDIVDYLSIAGSIKSYNFSKEEERYSAVIVYHDAESAELCKKYLGDRYYKGRVLTITTESKKSYLNGPNLSFDDEVAQEVAGLKFEEKKVLLGLMKNLKGEGQIFQGFLESKPKIVSALLGRYSVE